LLVVAAGTVDVKQNISKLDIKSECKSFVAFFFNFVSSKKRVKFAFVLSLC